MPIWRPNGHIPFIGPVVPIHLQDTEAEALRYLEKTGSLAEIYGTDAQAFAYEYKMDRRLRDLALIDSYNKITAKARLSLHLFDTSKVPVTRSRVAEEEDRSPFEAKEAGTIDQCIRVEVNGEHLSIRVTEDTGTWFAETTVPSARGRRRKNFDRSGESKSDVIHTIIHDAAVYLAQAHVKLHS